ncbi:MAG: flagellar biosynthesis repressor FlbT [Hyphococcus sp.]
MSGLILKLRPGEQVSINGVVIENGERKAHLRINSDGARILRMRDAIKPEGANTPLTKALLIAQNAVAGGLDAAHASKEIRRVIAACPEEASSQAASLDRLIEECVAKDDLYRLMRRLAALAKKEAPTASGDATPNKTT